jgi:ElaB/YqjD/DUF883 family membrane-anchored ribosome-binding protein
MNSKSQAGAYVKSATGHAEQMADDMRHAAGAAFGDARDSAERMSEDLADKLHRQTEGAFDHAKEQAKSAYADAQHAGEHYYREAKMAAGQSVSTVETYVRNNPVSSIFAALGVGFLVGLMTRK